MYINIFRNYTRCLLDYLALCKLKVVALMLVTVWPAMYLASNGYLDYKIFITTTLGITLCASSAAVINHLIDRNIDAKMTRTQMRPIAQGRIKPNYALLFAINLGISGFIILWFKVNHLTATLTLASLLGYAIIYTIFLKHATSQNIVIGGLAGATPPLLGWSAISGDISPYALLLTLIIFTWTPPHFWALAIFRSEDYAKAKIPMLPITHGIRYTHHYILLYTILLSCISILPFITNMSGIFYLVSVLILNSLFLYRTIKLWITQKNMEAIYTFKFSILYLFLLFIALLIDHSITKDYALKYVYFTLS